MRRLNKTLDLFIASQDRSGSINPNFVFSEKAEAITTPSRELVLDLINKHKIDHKKEGT